MLDENAMRQGLSAHRNWLAAIFDRSVLLSKKEQRSNES